MATRPIFLPQRVGDLLVKTELVDFHWSPGMALTQKQKSISALHSAAVNLGYCARPLEVSSKSKENLGVSLSAFNLKGSTKRKDRLFTVETLYQSSKVFENGGPYRDLLTENSRAAKMDARLKESGRIVGFDLFGEKWPIEPRTAFYDWIYLNTLQKNNFLLDQILVYDAFTDIEFNPKKSVNCQAYSVALFMALEMRNLLSKALKSREDYFYIIGGMSVNNATENTNIQSRLL